MGFNGWNQMKIMFWGFSLMMEEKYENQAQKGICEYFLI